MPEREITMLKAEVVHTSPDKAVVGDHCEVGYAVFFERIVFFVKDMRDLARVIGKKKTGEPLGTVKGLIPVDPYYVLYEWLVKSESFISRQKERKFLKKIGLSRTRMLTMKSNGQRTMTNFSRRPMTQAERNRRSRKMIDRNAK